MGQAGVDFVGLQLLADAVGQVELPLTSSTSDKADRGVARSDAPICDSAEWRGGEKMAKPRRPGTVLRRAGTQLGPPRPTPPSRFA